MSKSLAVAALGAVLMVLMAVPDAQSAPRRFCREYAATAVRQERSAREFGRCWDRIEGWWRMHRWASSYQRHYEWCRRASWQEVRQEERERSEYLQMCRYRWRD